MKKPGMLAGMLNTMKAKGVLKSKKVRSIKK